METWLRYLECLDEHQQRLDALSGMVATLDKELEKLKQGGV